MPVSRRRFLTMAGTITTSPSWLRASVHAQATTALTVQDVITRVQQGLGGAAPSPTVDGLKAGQLDQRVTGVATTAMATSEVIRLALARGCNLVITLEPTFFGRADQPAPPARAGDVVFAEKKALLTDRGVAVWRLRDQWLAQRPDAMTQGLAEALGWQRYQVPGQSHRVVLPAQRLDALVAHVRSRLGARGLRVVGDPALPVTRVVLSPGPSAPATTFTNLATADVILAGEPREWEGVEYVEDAITAGQPKGMVIVGRVLSEDPGMRVMAQWLSQALPGVRVETVAVGDKYWRPAAAGRAGR